MSLLKYIYLKYHFFYAAIILKKSLSVKISKYLSILLEEIKIFFSIYLFQEFILIFYSKNLGNLTLILLRHIKIILYVTYHIKNAIYSMTKE